MVGHRRPQRRPAPPASVPTVEEYEALEGAYKKLRKRNGAFNAVLCASLLIIALTGAYLGLVQSETLHQALTVLNEWSWETPTAAPLPPAQVGPPAAPAQNVQADPAPPAPSLNDPNTPAHGEQGGRPNEREAPPQRVQSIPPPSFGGRTNDHAPAVEVQAASPPSFGGRSNDHATPTPKPTLGGKPKK